MRISELDGLRGWAALSVVLFHVFWETFGVTIPTYRSLFVSGFINGQTAVTVFFLVSGAALSAPYHLGKSRDYLISATVRRHLRLAIPIFAAATIVYMLFHFGLMRGPEASVFVNREDWRGLNWAADVTFQNIFYFSFAGVFVGSPPQYEIIPFLWTMTIEFSGSALLFLALFCREQMQNPRSFFRVVACFLLLTLPNLSCFFLGSLLIERRLKRERSKIADHQIFALSSILALYVFSCLALRYKIPYGEQLRTIFCTLFFYQALNFEQLRRFLGENAWSIFLGKISFPIFLIHFAVIGSFTAPLIIRFHDHLGPKTSFAIGITTAAIAILAALAFLPLERFGHDISKKFVKLVLKGE
ncbi:acyltransferase [Rhizobium sp. SG570]|uniref:acyltransferase family protein n=1 Tax=Rhizobium sp. SG570 TaxID=2587113 RepID=UPI0014460DE2|nr:acyltransferase [Rhizobium sp. SG570]NKJ35282.1 peptidoglycan/LPS O-acetylase OafA/YrhL [Rhizobium sp. SG570]